MHLQMKLDQYLDYDLITITDIEGNSETGCPISVCYDDETPAGEDMIDIENEKGIFGFYEGDIKDIVIIK